MHEEGSCSAFNDWESLEEVAIERVREVLAFARQRFEADYPLRNTKSLADRANDLPALYRNLLHGKTIPDKNQLKRLHDLARLIGVDFPRR